MRSRLLCGVNCRKSGVLEPAGHFGELSPWSLWLVPLLCLVVFFFNVGHLHVSSLCSLCGCVSSVSSVFSVSEDGNMALVGARPHELQRGPL